ncbi:MAG: hypothetical protein WBQ14_01985 [Gaiellaceae bacterium]
MPVERRAERLASPLRPRDRYFLAAMACAIVLGIGAGAYAYASRPPAPSNEGCVVVTVASTLGGTTLRSCGTAASRFCRAQGKLNAGIAAECRRRGFLASG